MTAIPIDILKQRLSIFIRQDLGDYPTKRFQRRFDTSSRTAEDVLNGRATPPQFLRMLEIYGRPLSDFLFADCPSNAFAGDLANDLSLAARIDANADHTFASALAAFRRLRGVSAHADAGGDFGRHGAVLEGVGLDDDEDRRLGERSAPIDEADELRALRGAVDFNDELGLDRLDAGQTLLLDAWRDAGGELNDSLIGAIQGVGLVGLASVFDEQMRVRRIGSAVGLWSEEERQAARGHDLSELPSPPSYTRTVRQSLTASVETGAVLHHRICVRIGALVKIYRRMALPCPKTGVIVSVSTLEGA